MELEELVIQADLLKKEHPGCGVEKMYATLKPKTMGRDKFCEIFMSLGYGVKRTKNYRKTTIVGHLNYPNLIEGMYVNRPYQVIQSDITYFELPDRFNYLVFIIDIYTKVILGYHVGSNLRAEANLKALEMALSKMQNHTHQLIHHSDRGSQYGSEVYRKKLLSKGILISMGMKATENAYAERVNGIIKNEYLRKWKIKDENELKTRTRKAVNHYNNKRKHRSLAMNYSPSQFAQAWLTLSHQERPKVIVYTEGKPNLREASSHSEILPREEPKALICPMEI